ncbi:hypothetical protein Q428_00730 [Fervidicella metallireducens AeB]|uniref:DUF1232 domain-containing protein n=1 Tax=Fervidicella metallireducens AeB TaxID=1403537 RepID=A0A017RYS5_9CLOT|nr:hypothetical protein Q428_00730 [Fervidicella metallireducens AeB]
MKLDGFKNRIVEIKKKISILYMAYLDKRTPWYTKILALIVLLYAVSPIDLIPDFIPILGYLDDLLLIPLGISVVLRLIPKDVVKEYENIEELPEEFKKKGKYAGLFIILLWILILLKILRRFKIL